MIIDTSTPSNSDYKGNKGWTTTTILVVLLAGAVILLTVLAVYFIYKLKLSKLKERLLLEQSISLSRLDSTYSPESYTSQGTDYASIQTRRLPEPPPMKRPHDHLYQTPLPPGYLDMSGSRRQSSASRVEKGTRVIEEMEEGEERMEGEVEDRGDIYLKPTFPRSNQHSDAGCPLDGSFPSSIHPHSYGHTGHPTRQHPNSNQGEESLSSGTSSPNNPLLISQSINI